MILADRTSLFSGKEEDEKLIEELGGRLKEYRKDEVLLTLGDRTEEFALLLSGLVSIQRYDYKGNGELVAMVSEGEIFAENMALTGEMSPVVIKARSEAKVLWLKINKVLEDPLLVRNLLLVSSRRNLFLSRRLDHISKRTLKEKVMAFLSDEARRRGVREFMLEMDREDMAEYLACDRSALSLVLSKMKKEGLLDYSRNHFTINF